MGLRTAIVRGITRRPVPAPTPTAQGSGKVPGQNRRWTIIPASSWIDALRYVPVQREGNRKYTTGYIDMRVRKTKQVYRYGTRSLINEASFLTWINAASKGKYWWRYHTRRWSPAVKL